MLPPFDFGFPPCPFERLLPSGPTSPRRISTYFFQLKPCSFFGSSCRRDFNSDLTCTRKSPSALRLRTTSRQTLLLASEFMAERSRLVIPASSTADLRVEVLPTASCSPRLSS